MYSFTLNVPPLLNSYYGHIAQGKRVIKYIKKEGKAYKEYVKEYVQLNSLNYRANIPLKMTLRIYFKDKRRRDIDGPLKCLLDSLTEAEVYDDDELIHELNIKKLIDKENPRVEIDLEAS